MIDIQVHCISGAGNTFYFLNGNTLFSNLQLEDPSAFNKIESVLSKAKAHLPIRDGFVILFHLSSGRLRWDFYNWDLSSAEMCGNAARGAGLFAAHIFKLDLEQPHTLDTLAGPIEVSLISGTYHVTMPTEKLVTEGPPFIVNTGVPHAVIPLDSKTYEKVSLESDVLSKFVQQYRYPAVLDHAGCNITFLVTEPEGDGSFKAKTFERGVEGITQACGTGALAAGSFLFRRRNDQSQTQFNIRMPGGVLKTDFSSNNKIVLSGPTDYEKIMQIKIEDN